MHLKLKSREGDALDNVGFFFFRDPDGNRWAVQQVQDRPQSSARERLQAGIRR